MKKDTSDIAGTPGNDGSPTEYDDLFFRRLSHELRTPVTIIIGALKTAASPQITGDEKQQLIEDALYEAETLEGLLENILELVRFQTGRTEIHTEPVMIEPIVSSVLERITKSRELPQPVVDIPPGLPPAEADPLKIERVITNCIEDILGENPGGVLGVSARKEAGQLVISISTGVPDETVSSKADSGLRRQVSRILVEAHGGRLGTETRIGYTIHFSLPIATSVP